MSRATPRMGSGRTREAHAHVVAVLLRGPQTQSSLFKEVNIGTEPLTQWLRALEAAGAINIDRASRPHLITIVQHQED